jgi:hypothetical protein
MHLQRWMLSNSHSGRYVGLSTLKNSCLQLFYKSEESIAIDRSLEDEVKKCQFLNKDASLAFDPLSGIFPHPEPSEKALHIVVRAPPDGEFSRSVILPVLHRAISSPLSLHGR